MATFSRRFKITLTLWSLVGVTIIAAETVEIGLQTKKEVRNALGAHSRLMIYEDEVTGCQYVSTLNGLAVRLDEHGQPFCGKGEEK